MEWFHPGDFPRSSLLITLVLWCFQKLAALYFKRLYVEHFPNDTAAQCESECKWILKSMADSLKRAVEDGVLFSGGNAGHFGPGNRVVVGEGAVRRETSCELQRTFGDHNVAGLELYARCYEWTHWAAVLHALGGFLLFSWYFFLLRLQFFFFFYPRRSRASHSAPDA